MPDPVLTLLKYVFLAILYLFFLRVLRAVWVETREPKPAPPPDPSQLSQPVPAAGAAADEPPPGPERLVVAGESTQAGQEFPIGNEMTVGRAAGCAIHLTDDTFVSQLHARVYRQAKSIYVEDLGSTNGTFVNGKKVTSGVQVRKGDRVQFGRTTMEVRK